jgi:3-hydroxybutyrate dehydrogenase
MIKKPRVVIITGGAKGIGFAVAEAFARLGDQPIIADIEMEIAIQASTTLSEKYHCRPAAYKVDVANDDEVRRFIDSITEEWGTVHVLINNAGLQHVDPIERFPVEKWDLLIDVMLKGPFLLTKYCIPHMKKNQYGRIINISSVHGRTASPYKSAYVSAKHGVIGLTRTSALEVANDQITVNAVLPGTVDTELIQLQLQKLAESDGISREEALNKHLLAKHALKRFIKPEEVAACCIFLASDEAAAITGESVSVSGGW